jgi:ATPase subunit of ABC transporter with duplicated ATPase domains
VFAGNGVFMSILQAKNIRKSFGERELLKDVSFAIGESDVIGLVGINGSGKTTLMRIFLRREDNHSVIQIMSVQFRLLYSTRFIYTVCSVLFIVKKTI